jgi:hypothetical protein
LDHLTQRRREIQPRPRVFGVGGNTLPGLANRRRHLVDVCVVVNRLFLRRPLCCLGKLSPQHRQLILGQAGQVELRMLFATDDHLHVERLFLDRHLDSQVSRIVGRDPTLDVVVTLGGDQHRSARAQTLQAAGLFQQPATIVLLKEAQTDPCFAVERTVADVASVLLLLEQHGEGDSTHGRRVVFADPAALQRRDPGIHVRERVGCRHRAGDGQQGRDEAHK